MYSLAITLNPDLVAQIVAYAAAVGLLWPTVQALLQKPWWSPKAKSIITVAAAVVFGGAGYLVTTGFDFSNPSAIVVTGLTVFMDYAPVWSNPRLVVVARAPPGWWSPAGHVPKRMNAQGGAGSRRLGGRAVP